MAATRRPLLLPPPALLLALALALASAVVLATVAPTPVSAQRLLQTREARKDDAALPVAEFVTATEPVARALEAQVADAVAASVAAESTSSTNSTKSSATVTEFAASERSTTSTASTASTSASSSSSTSETHAPSESHAKSPTLSSFTGPMIAGAVAILLIGFVIAFKNRGS